MAKANLSRTTPSHALKTFTQGDCPSKAMLADLVSLHRDEGPEIFTIAAATIFLTAAASIAHVNGAARLHELVMQLGPLYAGAKPN
jgi:hypothetical protein